MLGFSMIVVSSLDNQANNFIEGRIHSSNQLQHGWPCILGIRIEHRPGSIRRIGIEIRRNRETLKHIALRSEEPVSGSLTVLDQPITGLLSI